MLPFLKLKDKFSKEKFSVGLDIGTQVIKIIKLKLLQEGAELCAFELALAQSEAEILRKIKQAYGVEAVNIAFSGPATVIRYVNFPKMNKEELSQALNFEAQKHIPFSISEVNLDSYILRNDLTQNQMFIALAAAKKESINQRLKLFDEAKIKINIIDIDSLALVNAFNFNYAQSEELKNKALALLNIGAAFSNLNILESGIPRLSRDIHIAGNNFTQKVADSLVIEFKVAEELKLNPDKERMGKITAAMESASLVLGNELRTSFDYYESQSAATVAKIFLSGGSALFPGIKDTLANLLGIEVELWDPFKKINLLAEANSEKLKAVSAQLAVAVGLALRA